MNKKILILLLSVLLTACANSTSSDSKAETEAVSETTTTTAVTTTDDSEQTTTATTTSISKKEIDGSSKTETSTKSSTKSTTTTTSQTVSITSKVNTQASTKAAQKSVVTTTTITTTKKSVTTTTTAKANTNSNVKPSGMTRLEDAVWELSFRGKDKNATYLNIVRDELIKYGQAYCKSNPACFKLFTINTKLYPYYDKDGKPLYAACDMKNRNIAVGSNVEFPYDEMDSPFDYATPQERLQHCKAFINRMQLLIERVLCNALHHGIANMEWYITYGFEAMGTDWVVMAHKPDANRVYF